MSGVRDMLAEAWDNGYACGGGDYGKSYGDTFAANPFATVPADDPKFSPDDMSPADRIVVAQSMALARIEALHRPDDLGDGPDGVVLCSEDAHSWPCPTVRACGRPSSTRLWTYQHPGGNERV